MTFCISWRIALFTLGFRTHRWGEERSGSGNMVTDGSGQTRNGNFKRFLHRNVGEAPLSSCRCSVWTTLHESAVDLNLPFEYASPEAFR